VKTPRDILLEKSRNYFKLRDEREEIEYANRKDELARLRKARKDEVSMLRTEFNKFKK
jgi:hypothetical protein